MDKEQPNGIIGSPLRNYCSSMDRKLRGKTIYEYYDKIHRITTKKPNYVTNLLFEDFKYRYKHQLNILTETYGQQGSGKSLFNQDMAHRIGEIYDMPFDMEKHTVADFDTLDRVLHDSPFRTTFIIDEQPRSFVGHGSSKVQKALSDYEEICRYTMKNINWIAPSEREHSSYYIFKEDELEPVERVHNQKCLECKRQSNCLKLYGQDKYNTLCGMNFYERHGYPISFRFMLFTDNKSNKKIMPRGYVRLPMLPPEMDKRYDDIKQINIGLFEQKKALGWSEMRERLREFQDAYKDKILKENGRPVSKNMIKVYIYDHFGNRFFTTTELDIAVSLVQSEIQNPQLPEKLRDHITEEE